MGVWEYEPLPRAIHIHVRSRLLFQAQKPLSNLSITKHANFKLDQKSSADFWECLIPTLSTAKVTCSTVLPVFPPSHQLLVSMVFSHRIITSSSYLVVSFMIANLIFSLLSGDLSGNFYPCYFSTIHVLFLPSFLLTFLQTDNSWLWQKVMPDIGSS